MTSPITGTNPNAHIQTEERNYFRLFDGDSELSSQQKMLVRIMNIFGLSLYVSGMALLGISIQLPGPELTDSDHMIMSSLRFPCLIWGGSVLCCAHFANTYFKKINREITPEVINEINKQVEEKIQARFAQNE
jgi:hypothetical protein